MDTTGVGDREKDAWAGGEVGIASELLVVEGEEVDTEEDDTGCHLAEVLIAELGKLPRRQNIAVGGVLH